ncbi:hypothetical protein GEMRC1_004321 [Eukaryota sp. GEM-RC1]
MDPGIFVCCHCFLGFCQHHAELHLRKTSHPVFANVITSISTMSPVNESSLSEQFAHGTVQLPHDKREITVSALCLSCDCQLNSDASPSLSSTLSAIYSSASAQEKTTAAVLEEGLPKPCPHLSISLSSTNTSPSFTGQCSSPDCDISENLWFCLTCHSLFCGRQQAFSVGRGHGLEHFHSTGHSVVVKVGTIGVKNGILTGEGFCYQCDDCVEVSDLTEMVNKLKIDLSSVIVEKSTLELNAAINIDFDVKELEGSLTPISNLPETDQSKMIGIENGGNNCYINSLLQSLKFLPSTSSYDLNHFLTCPLSPPLCLECQSIRVVTGLSTKPLFSPHDPFEAINSPTPFLFKTALARGNPEWMSLLQQDVVEYFQFLLKVFAESKVKYLETIASSFDYDVRVSTLCCDCDHVSIAVERCSGPLTLYLPEEVYSNAPDEQSKPADDVIPSIKLIDLLSSWSEEVISFSCGNCSGKTGLKSRRFMTYPQCLPLVVNRFCFREGKPVKILVKIDPSNVEKSVSALHCTPLDNPITSSSPEKSVNPELLSQLMSLGISKNHATNALIKNDCDLERAAEWAFTNEETAAEAHEVSDKQKEMIGMLTGMGFSTDQSRAVAYSGVGSIEEALEWVTTASEEVIRQVLQNHAESTKKTQDLAKSAYRHHCDPKSLSLFSLISHKGSSALSGHYICHVSHPSMENVWVLFNDLKVGVTEAPPFEYAYMYLLK